MRGSPRIGFIYRRSRLIVERVRVIKRIGHYRIPDATQTGTKFTIRNKGFKGVNSSAQGDFVFTVQVQVPKRLTKEQRDLLVELAKTMNEQKRTILNKGEQTRLFCLKHKNIDNS